MKNKFIKLRTANVDDYFACLPLLTTLYHGDIGANFQHSFENFVNHEESIILLAEHSNKVIGILIGSHHLDIDWEGKIANIDALIVDETFRRMKIGRKLVRCFVTRARKDHCKVIRSRVNRKNKIAQSFHEAFGFTKANTYEYILDLQGQNNSQLKTHEN
ncbi:MAG: GNAT family N-acetyltransferase [Promethearchaeota archaeon]